MPSATPFPTLTLSNLGPLTTTYTAPASCATQPFQTMLAYSESPSVLFMAASCDEYPPYGDCIPSGSVIDGLVDQSETTANPGINTAFYYSPGLACPSDWATVGLASKDAAGTLTSSGAAFALPTVSIGPFLGSNPANNIMLGALDPAETLVMCCPSSMTAGLNANCWSTLPPFPISTACARFVQASSPIGGFANTTMSLLGTTFTGSVYSWPTTPVTVRPKTTTMDSEIASLLVGVDVSPMIMLAHRASETAAPTTGTGSETTGESTPAPTSAAGALAPLWMSVLGLGAGLAFVLAM